MMNHRIKSTCGAVNRVVAARILPGKDLLEGIEEICKMHNISYAQVTCFGSLMKCGYMYLVPNEQEKMKAGYGEVLRKEGPIEFLNGIGVVCQNEGAYDIHFHATLCDATGSVFGGHMIKCENPVLTTIDTMIYEIKDLKMLRKFDDETRLTQFYPCDTNE